VSSAARIDSPQRYPLRTPQERARFIRAEAQLILRFHRAGLLCVSWKCHVCRNGRVTIKRKENLSRIFEIRTSGKCSSPDCLEWED